MNPSRILGALLACCLLSMMLPSASATTSAGTELEPLPSCVMAEVAAPCCEEFEDPVTCQIRITGEIIAGLAWFGYVVCKDATAVPEATCNDIFCSTTSCVELEQCPTGDGEPLVDPWSGEAAANLPSTPASTSVEPGQPLVFSSVTTRLG